ncbi:MAG: aminotransferase class IV, partial [Muribaculaceae bacterium]|nr:aminotransferase class IV [Muribaculaceae bacterium]
VTPKSDSILPSIPTRALMTLAREMGIEVEERHITIDELERATEAGACGTAAVISPVGKIKDIDTGKEYIISPDGKPGPVSTALYERLNAIRQGEYPDEHGWNTIVE